MRIETDPPSGTRMDSGSVRTYTVKLIGTNGRVLRREDFRGRHKPVLLNVRSTQPLFVTAIDPFGLTFTVESVLDGFSTVGIDVGLTNSGQNLEAGIFRTFPTVSVDVPQDKTPRTKKSICLRVIVLRGTTGGVANGGSRFSAGTANDKDEIQKLIDCASVIWCQCEIKFEFDKEKHITFVDATADMVDKDGNLIIPTEALLGHFFLNYADKIDRKCLNILLIKNGKNATVKITDKTIDAPNRNGNLSTIEDNAVLDKDKKVAKEPGAQTIAHELGHQLMLADILADPDEEKEKAKKKRLMWFNRLTRAEKADGGAQLVEEECKIAYKKVCTANEEGFAGFDFDGMVDFLIESLTGFRDQKDLVKKLRKKFNRP